MTNKPTLTDGPLTFAELCRRLKTIPEMSGYGRTAIKEWQLRGLIPCHYIPGLTHPRFFLTEVYQSYQKNIRARTTGNSLNRALGL